MWSDNAEDTCDTVRQATLQEARGLSLLLRTEPKVASIPLVQHASDATQSRRMSAPRDRVLDHQLAPHYAALRAIRTRRALEASRLWAEIGGEVERVLDGVERVDHAGAKPPAGTLRAVAWNIQRGTELGKLCDAFASHPELSRADVLLLSEVDVGMGRSKNRNVPRELADALGMSYAFAVSYIALEDDHLENPDGVDNTLALAGSAILSRAPILRAISANVPALRDKFASSEKRLGRKRAVVAEIATANGPIAIAQAHLDSKASSAQRALQLAAVIDAADALGVPRLLLGGDLNTTTYNWGSTMGLARDLLHKLAITGFDRTIDNYMTPELLYERPVFELLAARGLAIDGFNDRAHGTLRYDFAEPYTIAKTREAVGGLLTRWLVRRLRSRNGVVEARLDWFAGRGLAPLGARVERPRPNGARASDHEPISVEIEI
ncbi:MAG: endonuclease [Myxococcales bacterium]|nr:endonuclease [Myxococcales bacterium]